VRKEMLIVLSTEVLEYCSAAVNNLYDSGVLDLAVITKCYELLPLASGLAMHHPLSSPFPTWNSEALGSVYLVYSQQKGWGKLYSCINHEFYFLSSGCFDIWGLAEAEGLTFLRLANP
jgi:hypothetical protein